MFKGKVAVITGAGSGIGRALATGLAAEGARLAISDINLQGLEETRALCGDAEVRTYQLNVADKDTVFAHAEQVKQDFGTAHIVINNAGASLIGTVEHTTIEEYEWLLGIDLWGVVYGTKAFLPMMLEQKEGYIVNISSTFGLVSFRTQSAYNICKFAVRGFTECLWQELEGSGVKAISVHPGGIKTNIERAAPRVAAAGEEEANFAEISDPLLVTPPEVCAQDILNGIRRGKNRVITGKASTTIFWLSRIFPNSYHKLMRMVGL